MKKFLFYLLASLLLIGVGIFMIALPDRFLGIVVIIFSLFIIFDGLKSFYLLFRVKVASSRFRWTMGLKALINSAIGVISIMIAIFNPTTISKILVYLIAADFFATAIVDLFDYMILRTDALVTGTLGFEIIISILFGVLFCIFPQFVSHTAVTILAVIVICTGVMAFIIGSYGLYVERTFKKFGIDPSKKSAGEEFSEIDDDR